MLIGPIVQWASALLLLVIFSLFRPLSSQRRLIVIWSIAWAAQLVMIAWPAATGVAQVLGRPSSMLPAMVAPLYWPAEFVFLAAVTLGALGAAGKSIPIRTERAVLAISALLGILVAATDSDISAHWIQFIATPLVFFGCVQMLLMRADTSRRRGLLFLAVAMMLAGTLMTLYLFRNFEHDRPGTFAKFVHIVWYSSGYGDAVVLALLGAAAIVVIVQEAMLDVARAHEKRIRDVAASEFRLNGIIQAAQEAIVTADPDGRVDLLNAAAANLFRIAPDQALGRPLESFIPEVADSFRELAQAASAPAAEPARGVLATHLGHCTRHDNTTFPVEFTIGRLNAANRSGSVLVLRDLTERHAAEAERELFERRMAESEKMLAIGRIVSGVAHELNNPLAVVLGQSEQLVEAAPAGELQSGLRMIHEQAHRARHIVKDLLAFVRHNEEHREVVDLARLAERTTAAQLDTAMTHGVTLLSDLPSMLPAVMIDPVAIEQILVNLIDNALDAAGTDGTARISARALDGRIELAVEDSGHGVRDELVGRIFEPFFSTKGPGHGTGLGLSVSSGLAEQQGGSLRFENRPAPGIGARFVLTVPIALASATESAPTLRSGAFPQAPKRADGSAAEVMLIDDEPSVRATLGKMFKRAGWQVREAESGDAAVAWLNKVSETAAPELILCDLKMPGMSGRDVFEHLMAQKPAFARRLIFVTGDVVESVSNGFISASGREVVEKPFTVSEISRAVERVLNL